MPHARHVWQSAGDWPGSVFRHRRQQRAPPGRPRQPCCAITPAPRCWTGCPSATAGREGIVADHRRAPTYAAKATTLLR